ncbi:MAG: exonuclease SbcCD subunit D [Myxococcota bacterium]|nr:exonuclease SbcCD subunit D [Myxococcota bacterium]
MARFIHTSDWHLGFSLRERRLHEDQVHIISQIADLVEKHRPDAVLIAGDIYDRPVAPAPAIQLFDDFISRVAIDLETRVVVIPGNHDSPERIGQFRRLLGDQHVHLFGKIVPNPKPIVIKDQHGELEIFGLPYLYPAEVKNLLQIEEHSVDAEHATRAMIEKIHEHSTLDRKVLLSHAYVTGCQQSDSEQDIIGNVNGVPADVFDGFSYVALGHLHRPQSVGQEHIQYSGSILKYSASEMKYTKSVNLFEIDEKGEMSRFERIPLNPLRDLRTVEGPFEEILAQAQAEPSDDFIFVLLDDQHTIPNAMSRLQEFYPNCLHIRPKFLDLEENDFVADIDVRTKDLGEVFTDFWLQSKNELPSAELVQIFKDSLIETQKKRAEKQK